MTSDEMLLKLVEHSMKLLREDGVALVRQGKRRSASFDIPGTSNKGRLRLEEGIRGQSEACFVALVWRDGTDRAVQNFLYFAPTYEDMQDYLMDEKTIGLVINSLKSLSARVDAFDDE